MGDQSDSEALNTLPLRFTLKQLRYFVAAGDAGSILKASENIHVSQPSISSAISHLEETFGLQLFLRHHAQGVSLTSAGREFLRETKALLSQADELHNLAGALSDQVVGIIEVGCFNPLAPIIIPELCHGFMASHPGSDIRVREAHQEKLLQQLRVGNIDLALTYDLELHADIEFVPLAELPPYVLLSASHPLAERDILTLEDVVSLPMILLDLPLSSEYFMGLFRQQELKPTIKARTALTDVQRGLVGSGYGYSLANVRPNNMASLDGNPLKYIPLHSRSGDTPPPLNLGIAMVRELHQNKAQRTFIEYCKDRISTNQIPGMDFS
ncbi:MAG: LysR family transcriptional regulator [Acidiferrobacterales bacterium]|nr:LysR family transcriptional regulator [Acidiferrobacterales bacterium]